MSRQLHIGIAGCGIGGLAAGTFLARAGHRVTIYDQMVKPTPVGSGLIIQPVGQFVLRELGLLDRLEELGSRIDRLFGRTSSHGRVVLDVGYGNQRYGVAVHRATLFELLLGAAQQSGVEVVFGKLIEAVTQQDAKRLLLSANDGTHGPFDLIIDALGVRSSLSPTPARPLSYGALWANLEWQNSARFNAHALEQRYDKAEKMVGVLPIGCQPGGKIQQAAFFWSLKHVHFDQWKSQSIERWKEEVLALWPEVGCFVDQINGHDDLVFATYAHKTLRKPVSSRVVHIGDSYHAASPQLGQGANMALLDARALFQAFEEQDDIERTLTAFVTKRRWHVRVYQAASWMFTPVYQSDSRILPLLRDKFMGPLSKIPPAPYLLSRLVAGDLLPP